MEASEDRAEIGGVNYFLEKEGEGERLKCGKRFRRVIKRLGSFQSSFHTHTHLLGGRSIGIDGSELHLELEKRSRLSEDVVTSFLSRQHQETRL